MPEEKKKKALPAFRKGITKAEVAKHSEHNDCWIILHNHVYDVTDFLVINLINY
jgi:cytochrome b involved in lipid metabolism